LDAPSKPRRRPAFGFLVAGLTFVVLSQPRLLRLVVVDRQASGQDDALQSSGGKGPVGCPCSLQFLRPRKYRRKIARTTTWPTWSRVREEILRKLRRWSRATAD